MSLRLPGGSRLRRYPALAFLLVAAVLATLLPSSLLIPLSGPSSSAELSPVPGKSDGAGDLSALGGTSTGGLGSGSGFGPDSMGPTGALDQDGGGSGGGSGADVRNMRCVGKPPRQTEDPLSPTCVGFFEGDNGGATAKGVTADEITVVLDYCADDAQAEAFVDYHDEDDPNIRPALRAYANHFNARYQLYGRRAHFFEARLRCNNDVERRARMQRIDETLSPFAVVPVRSSETGADTAARLNIVTLLHSPLRSFTESRAPFVYSVAPDLDEQVASLAEFVCRRLAGRPARYSGDPLDHGRTRVFGLYYKVPSDYGGVGAPMLQNETRRRCGVEMVQYNSREWEDAGPTVAARMRNDGVTTMVALDTHVTPALAATTVGWHPEWVVRDAGTIGTENIKIVPPEQLRNSLGISFRRRQGIPQEAPAYIAAEDGCAGCGSYSEPAMYEDFLFLFRGIQAAGPRLTPAAFARGLRALTPHRSVDPFRPAAYLGAGDHYWFRDAMAWWWDPGGRPPGGRPGGCWRLVEDGARYRTEDWHMREGDAGFMGTDGTQQPCQGGR